MGEDKYFDPMMVIELQAGEFESTFTAQTKRLHQYEW